MVRLNRHRTYIYITLFIYKTAVLVTLVRNRRGRLKPKSQCFPKPNKVDLITKPNQVVLITKPDQTVTVQRRSGTCFAVTLEQLCCFGGC